MSEPQQILLKDYKAPPFLATEVHLIFDLRPTETIVENTMKLVQNPAGEGVTDLFLNGENLVLKSLTLDGRDLSKGDYQISEEGLTIPNFPEAGTLKVVTQIVPHENKAFSGLYQTKNLYCTQMEAEGFRRVTFFQDRPDVLSIYTTTVIADKTKFPTLLSNGEFADSKDLDNGRHQATWHDPFPKPSYLFALVAGDFDVVKDSYNTESNKKVDLAIYVDKGKASRARHAMLSLKQSMKWDEETYGLEYDLNVYNIVAVDDFNMGAMENKGLNIFNSKYVLADMESATDEEFTGILRVIGHEYFHNWSGNRVTCRDWFQLSLKEGLTVYRDQEFTCDLTTRDVKRIEDVDLVRTRQFPEDSGPMAHPVRPPSYISIDNFYTVTVYHKGAEVIRMLENIVGIDMFKKGLSHYFKLFDGQAVTTDDFISAMEQVSSVDLTGFKRWYDQAGTPEVSLSTAYDEEAQTLTLNWQQTHQDPMTKKPQLPFHIPIRLGALDSNGSSMAFSKTPDGDKEEEILFELTDNQQSLTLYSLKEKPHLSVLRGFTAPIRLNFEQSNEALYLLMVHDSDAFSRWEASQKIYLQTLLEFYENLKVDKTPAFPKALTTALEALLENAMENPALSAQLLTPPNAHYLMQFLTDVDPQTLDQARRTFKSAMAKSLHSHFLKLYQDLDEKKLGNQQGDIGLRSLKNTLLGILSANPSDDFLDLASKQYSHGPNMTEKLAALRALSHHESPKTTQALEDFYKQWKSDPLVINKYFSVCALASTPGTFENLEKTMTNTVYDNTNPNNIYALLNQFGSENWKHFHKKDGAPYIWFANQILEIDARNPQVASRLASSFNIWKKLAPSYQAPMKKALELIHKNKCSKNLFEIVDRALASS